MKRNEIEKPFETEVNGEIYCFRFENPVTRNGGRTFSGVAVAWKKGTDDQFTVPFYVDGENISQSYSKIIEGIREIVNK